MLTEIRVLSDKKTYSGYFKDVVALIKSAESYDRLGMQIYFTLNRVKDACYARNPDRIEPVVKNPTTGDSDIECRTHVLIDLDPKRPSGVSSNDEELELAHKKAVQVYYFLLEQGFNKPIVCKSGNGYHLVIPCEIDVNAGNTEIIKKFLKVLSLLFSDERVEVDEKVFNPARICKLYGTMARKGVNTLERPWRQSEIVLVPDELKPTAIEYFKKVAAMYPEEERPNKYNGYSTERFNLTDFLNKNGINYKTERMGDGTKYILDHCPFNDQHRHKDAVLFQRDNGAIAFVCLHNSCAGKTWRDFRLLYEPDAYDKEYHPFSQNYKIPMPPPLRQTQEKGEIWLSMSKIKKPKIDLADYIPSGIPLLDDRGLGFRRGQVSVWTGFRGCGKSSLLNMLILNAAQKGYKSALWTGELTPDMEKQWLYLQAAGKQYTKRFGSTDYFYVPDYIAGKIDPWMDKHVWLFNNKYGDNFLQIKEQIKRIKKEQNIDCAFLDNLMVLNIRELEQEKYGRQAVLLQQLRDLAEKLNIHIHLVAHPHKAFNYLRVDDIGGSGEIGNKADNIFILSRVNNDFIANAHELIDSHTYTDIISSGCTNVIEVAKFRNKGSLVGSFAKLWFELESNRLKNELAENVIYNWNPPHIQTDLPFDEPNEDEVCPF